jgi:hypothetical protein
MWNLENLRVSGKYMDEFPITGKVRVSRIKYGGGVSHHIDLDTPINVYGSIRESVVVNHSDIEQVFSN